MLDPLELEVHARLNCLMLVLGPELRLSGRIVRTRNHCTIFPAQCVKLLMDENRRFLRKPEKQDTRL